MKYLPLLAATLLAALALAACGGDDNGGTATPSTSGGSGSPSVTPEPTPVNLDKVCQDNPDPAASGVAQIESPKRGDHLRNPVTVKGLYAAFEAQFKIAIYDYKGELLADQPARSNEGQTLAPFSESVQYFVEKETAGCIWVYDPSQQDGSPAGVVQIPVILEPRTEPNVCGPNPDPFTSYVLQVDEPVIGDTVTSSFTVSGRVAAFEATFAITLYDANQQVITDVVGHSQEGQTLSPFSEQVSFPAAKSGPACLWVYEKSARDGSPIHVAQVPVILK